MLHPVLVIEDDDDIAHLLKFHVEELSCRVTVAGDGHAGLALAESGAFDLIILDFLLPGIDGPEIAARVRAKSIRTPILMVTARTTQVDRALGVEDGIDDCMAKPFSLTDLIARVRAMLQRMEHSVATPEVDGNGVVEAGTLRIDAGSREVRVGSRRIELTPKEFDLLLFFARNPGRVFSREQLLHRVSGVSHGGRAHTVNSLINRLRAKIERDPDRPEMLQAVLGVGYRFVQLPPDAP